MQIISKPATRTVTYRYLDITFPHKTVSFTLTPDDYMDADEHGNILITFGKDKRTVTVFMQHAYALEQQTVTREEPVRETAGNSRPVTLGELLAVADEGTVQ